MISKIRRTLLIISLIYYTGPKTRLFGLTTDLLDVRNANLFDSTVLGQVPAVKPWSHFRFSFRIPRDLVIL